MTNKHATHDERRSGGWILNGNEIIKHKQLHFRVFINIKWWLLGLNIILLCLNFEMIDSHFGLVFYVSPTV